MQGLYKASTIKRLSAGVLLLLFMFSITPKIFVHALVAGHKDVHLSIGQEGTDQLNKASFHCDVENLVVELPYLYCPFSFQLEVLRVFRDHQTRPAPQFYSPDHFIFGLRGPPAVV